MRVPRCPDCGAPGIPVRDTVEFFRCECGSVWKEVNWMKKLAEESKALAESKRFEGIMSLLAIGDGRIKCDKCGHVLCHAEKYCYDGKRYCVKCSIKAGYLQLLENRHTGERVYGILCTPQERYVDSKETPKYFANIIPIVDTVAKCRKCDAQLCRLHYSFEFNDKRISVSNREYIVVCDNPRCSMFRLKSEGASERDLY